MRGKVYLVGAGPGAADLITVRGAELLRRAGIIFYDALVQAEMLALAPTAKKVLVGKRCRTISTDQRFINRCLVEAALKHDVVVRLKGGDPMLFGRAAEEMAALQSAGIEFEVVPGITAALAASAELKVSLTRRGVSRGVALVTPRIGRSESDSNWVDAVMSADTAVLYMGAGQATEIARALLAKGMRGDTPVSILENASLADSRRVDCVLAELLAAGDIAGPAVIMLGKVFERVELRQGQRALLASL